MKTPDSQVHLTDAVIKQIPYQSLAIYALYLVGIDIEKKVSKPTLSRHRAILRAYGIELKKPV
jgi:hypothetical protein